MHRTFPGAVITVLIALSVLSALQATQGVADGTGSLRALTLVAVIISGVLAVRALLRAVARVRTYVVAWAAAIIAHLLLADVQAGFVRPGLEERILATALVATILGAIVSSVPRPRALTEAANDAGRPSTV